MQITSELGKSLAKLQLGMNTEHGLVGNPGMNSSDQ
jgi:hypothetical protein